MGKQKKEKKQKEVEETAEVEEMDQETSAAGEKLTNGMTPLPMPSTEKEDYDSLFAFCNVIAKPMAPRKTAKKVYKLIKKSTKVKFYCRQGIVDVQRALRKKETGIVVLAGDVAPVDIYAHIPAMCEEMSIPYCYTPSKHHLGLAAGHRRPSIMVLIRRHDDYAADFDELHATVDKLVIPE